MTDTLKITKEQLKALEAFKEAFEPETCNMEDFSLLMNGLFEIDHDFREGDWVYAENRKHPIGRLEEVWHDNDERFNFENGGSVGVEDIRYATETEIIQEKERRKMNAEEQHRADNIIETVKEIYAICGVFLDKEENK